MDSQSRLNNYVQTGIARLPVIIYSMDADKWAAQSESIRVLGENKKSAKKLLIDRLVIYYDILASKDPIKEFYNKTNSELSVGIKINANGTNYICKTSEFTRIEAGGTLNEVLANLYRMTVC